MNWNYLYMERKVYCFSSVLFSFFMIWNVLFSNSRPQVSLMCASTVVSHMQTRADEKHVREAKPYLKTRWPQIQHVNNENISWYFQKYFLLHTLSLKECIDNSELRAILNFWRKVHEP